MKYYIIAGEASGDLLGSYLMKEIKQNDPQADFLVWGGDLMEAQGGELAKHYKDLAFMGFWEVAKNLRTIFRNLAICKTDLLLYEPDVVILIDYPGFNMRIAEFAKENGFKVVYYVSPSVWAWKKNRVFKIKRDVDMLLTILPFEKEFYAKFGYDAAYIGHPLLDVLQDQKESFGTLEQFKEKYNLDPLKPIIAILPGSRKQELERILPMMLTVIDQYPDHQFVISKVKWQPEELYHKLLNNRNIPLIEGDTYPMLQHAEAALVTSGTATLETALIGTPQVVCYKTSHLSYKIAKMLVGKHLKYISLVNLIMDETIVTELIQGDMNTQRVKKELDLIVYDPATIATMKNRYAALKEKLGNSGASAKGAKLIHKFLQP